MISHDTAKNLDKECSMNGVEQKPGTKHAKVQSGAEI